MKLRTIDTGYFKLDGGAMFGVVPKSLWNKLNPADDNNMCTWAMRCLLIQTQTQNILIDTGIGDKQGPDFFKHYFLHGSRNLRSSLHDAGLGTEQVTDVILTHLHFDHVGGAVYKDGDLLKLTFPNAKYWIHSQHLAWALTPNLREKASFLSENIQPLVTSGQLYYLDQHNLQEAFEKKLEFIFVDGHTERQTLPLIKYKGHQILYCADLIPSAAHIPLPYIMSYDMQPLMSLQEKQEILERAYTEGWYLYFEHDPINEMCTLQKTDKGIRALSFLSLSEL
jgi:glyoxylase-like metal-dependent hydrolase (beta-lactamase superfamily II)